MGHCKGTPNSGSKCKNSAQTESNFCHRHYEQGSNNNLFVTGAGAAIGHLIAPGIGGMITGGLTGFIINKLGNNSMTTKTRVFVSFDFDKDKRLKDFIIGQSRLLDSPFDVADHSLKEAAPERNWKDKARANIKRSNIVLVMVGPETHKAPGVLAEISMAREEGIPIVQIIGYKDGDYTAVPNAGRLYKWNWDNLKKILG